MPDTALKTSDQVLPDPDKLSEQVSYALQAAKAKGASAAEAGVSIEAGLSATARLGEVETLEYHRDRGIGVTVYFGQRKGTASTSDFTRKALDDTVAAACDIARYTAEDPCAGLADSELMAKDIPDLDLYHPWGINAGQAIELAKTCEQTARDTDTRITNSEGATVSSHEALSMYGNSHGFMGGYSRTRHSVSCAVIGEQDRIMQRDYWYTVARDAAEMDSAEAVGKRAAERTVRRLGGRQIPTCHVPVIFQAEVAGGLFGHFVSAIRGGSLYRRSSFLLDALDTQVFPEFMNIQERPHLPGALGSAPFDSEGVSTRDRDLVSAGVLKSYLLDSYSARKLDMQTTGNAGGVRNLVIDTETLPFTELLQRMGTGLVVTELMGQGVKLVTGDYSRGAAGFWIENGEVQYPVEEITIAGNLRDMFKGIQAIGSDTDIRGNIRAGSVLIDNMTIAGG